MKTYRPTSEGLRQKKNLVYDVTKARPEKSLLRTKKGAAGRNHGRISSASRQRGVRKLYRVIDFKRDKFGIPAVVNSIEYDPNRGPNLALLFYVDGEKMPYRGYQLGYVKLER